jgi:hypothetical protein
MSAKTLLVVVFGIGLVLALPSVAQQRGQGPGATPPVERPQADRGRDRIGDAASARDREQQQARDRLRDPALHMQDRDRFRDRDVYGSELMTPQEREQYRERLGAIQNDAAWARMQLQHQQQMEARARERGVDIDPPLYGQHVMTVREQMQHRRALQRARNETARSAIRREHQAQMQARARELGVDVPAPFYGQQLMSDAEREQLRARIAAAGTEQERAQIRAEHRSAMMARARERQIDPAELEAE